MSLFCLYFFSFYTSPFPLHLNYVTLHLLPVISSCVKCCKPCVCITLPLPSVSIEAEPAGGGAGGRAHWPEEGNLREWLLGNAGGGARGKELISVRCDDGRLNVKLDTHILQVFTLYLRTHAHTHSPQFCWSP